MNLWAIVNKMWYLRLLLGKPRLGTEIWCLRAVRDCHMAGSPLGLGLAKGLVVYSLLAGGPPLVGKDVQPLQSV